jgi:hypothetical protein
MVCGFCVIADWILDGGGIRGYSSLLILRHLLTLVAALEQGQSELIKAPEPQWPKVR